MKTIIIHSLLVACFIIIATSEIYDPVNIFCGSNNCYDILGVSRNSDIKTIKKAYRKLSLTEHPDKSKASNATEIFRKISKAFEVLTGNESRNLFDYYLDHPREYFKVSGHHYMKNLPKSDVKLVITVVLLLISWFFHTIQYQKYEKLIKYLKKAVINNLGLKNGGTKQTIELYRKATELYDEKIKSLKLNGDKNAGKVKMIKDPLFEQVVNQLVDEIKIEGGYRKPVWQDLVIIKVIISPYSLVLWLIKYHRRYISKQPIPLEDKLEMAMETLGLATWEEMDESLRMKLIDREIWKSEVYLTWKEEEMKKLVGVSKGGKRKNKKNVEYDEDEDIIE